MRCERCPVRGDILCNLESATNRKGCKAVCQGSPQAIAVAIHRSEADVLKLSDASVSRETGQPNVVARYNSLLAARLTCPHLGSKCATGCGGDVHQCTAGMSSWPGQPNRAGYDQCITCPLFPWPDDVSRN